MSESKGSMTRVALIGALLFPPVAVPAALAQEGAQSIEEVVVVGSRRAGRSATDSPVPVDVVTGEDFENQGTSDMDDMLRNLLPSYNVQRFPISDAATLTRPATLRGLPPDSTLLLVNGKRRHRGAVIAELGGNLAEGSQGPDIAVIPSMAIDRVEVLRDGASAQYGSDAIAGVINMVLKDDREGLHFEGRYGETYEGDGAAKKLGVNWGLPLGPDGFANLTFEWKEADPTSRSLQRTDAQGLIDTGNSDVRQPYAQIWGSPEISDDFTFFLNSGIDLTDNQHLYGFGNYAERKVEGGFFYRNPNNRSGVFTSGSAQYDADGDGLPDISGFDADNNPIYRTIGLRAVMDPGFYNSGVPSGCPAVPSPGGSVFDGFQGSDYVSANPGCFVFNALDEGGFTPQFGGNMEDIAAVVGLRGEMDSGLSYDFSVGLGRNEASFFLNNTFNPSLGPESGRDFSLGKYIQTEQNYNADFVYPLAVDAFYSDLNIAFGAEYRVETFEIRQGKEDSWIAGDFAFQPEDGLVYPGDVQYDVNGDGTPDTVFTGGLSLPAMSIAANGFAGFSPPQVGEFERTNWATYVDLEADIFEGFTLGVAGRYEEFDDFGDTLNGKIAARWALTDSFALRGSASTGFRAPTPGQSNVTKVSTITVQGVLQQQGQIPPTNPIAVALGGQPLDAEDATNFTFGAVWGITDSLELTVDYYNINVKDRISSTGTIDIADLYIGDYPDLVSQCGLTVSVPECLQLIGVPGAADLSSVNFYTNDFETTTQGVDAVLTWSHDWGNFGLSNVSFAWNWTETEVDKIGDPISRDKLVDLENFNPEHRGIITLNHFIGDFRLLFRASYYDDWTSADYLDDPTFTQAQTNYTIDCTEDGCFKGKWIFDVEGAYTFADRYTIVAGAQNVFDQDAPADANNSAGPNLSSNSGEQYDTSTPWGFDGGFWYVRLQADF
ncbi:MAG: TonB-dependent receptor plug domain-containing protein [Pseudomonadales bacterium]